MNKKFNHFTKLAGVALATLLSITGVASASAWGPSRDTFTMETPATYPTFNSITNNPVFGDERDFVRVGQVNADVTDLTNEVEIIPGRQYLVYVYFHNNASSIYNYAEYNNSGIALGTRLSTTFSTVVTPTERGTISAKISANNTEPSAVWDEAYLTTKSKKVVLHYVAGSAKIYNDWATNGSIMPSSMFTDEGALLGLTSFNGAIPGCEEYSGAVTYVLQAEELAGTVEKTVSKDGTNFGESVTANPGEELTFKLTIKNTGGEGLSNATVADVLPNGLSLVPGSVQLWANDSTKKDSLSDNITSGGYNLGYVGAGNTVYISYRATLGKDFDCNNLRLSNTAKLTYDSNSSAGDSDESSAIINVHRDGCEGTPTRIVDTGPVEIVMACVIILGIGGGAIYLVRTRRAVRAVTNEVSGAAGATGATDKPASEKTAADKAVSNKATSNEETPSGEKPENPDETNGE